MRERLQPSWQRAWRGIGAVGDGLEHGGHLLPVVVAGVERLVRPGQLLRGGCDWRLAIEMALPRGRNVRQVPLTDDTGKINDEFQFADGKAVNELCERCE